MFSYKYVCVYVQSDIRKRGGKVTKAYLITSSKIGEKGGKILKNRTVLELNKNLGRRENILKFRDQDLGQNGQSNLVEIKTIGTDRIDSEK